MVDAKPGELSDALKTALGMPTEEDADPIPPPWLLHMQRCVSNSLCSPRALFLVLTFIAHTKKLTAFVYILFANRCIVVDRVCSFGLLFASC